DRLAWVIWVQRSGDRVQLIQVTLASEMRTLAAHIGKTSDNVARQFVLDVKMPLLHIRPHDLFRNSCKAEGERRSRSSSTDICISGNVILSGNLDEGSRLA